MRISLERPGRRAPWVAMAIAFALLPAPTSTKAHPHVCSHTHSMANPDEATCNSAGTPASVRGQSGVCQNTTTAQTRCVLLRPPACGIEMYLKFLEGSSSLPSEGLHTYTVSTDPLNQTEVLSGLGLLTDYPTVPNPLTGSFVLDFGPFTGGTVAVEIISLSLTLAPFTVLGFSTGPIDMHLGAVGDPQFLEYDPSTQTLRPVASADKGIDVLVDYNLAVNEPTTVWLGAEFGDPSGSGIWFVGVDANLPFFLVPSLAPAAVTVLVLLTAAAGGLVLRKVQRRARVS